MKAILVIVISTLCYACFPAHELQAEMVDATLVKVEEVNRYPNVRQKILTWQTERAISFVTIEPAATEIPLGTHTKVLMQR
ncbi:MAG TPA: hypothetical protein VFL47_17285 [Flavisolibacter sp.]|nr:hypothetical protein [Flavisolibacter sp.]